MAEITDVTDANFESEVLNSSTPVLVDFWAEWCAPCKAIAPIVKEIADDNGEKLKVVKMNIDESPSDPRHLRHPLDPDPARLQGRPGREPAHRCAPEGRFSRHGRRGYLTSPKSQGSH
jgi:thiol-disulfide isomerase/thioredoxin